MRPEKHRYEIRRFKIEDGGYHECSGQVVAVLQSFYSGDRQAWYVTVLVRKDWRDPHPGVNVERRD